MNKMDIFIAKLCASDFKRFHNRSNSRAFIDKMDSHMENVCSNFGGVNSFSKHVFSFCRARTQCAHKFFFECSRSAIVSKNKRNNATPSPSE